MTADHVTRLLEFCDARERAYRDADRAVEDAIAGCTNGAENDEDEEDVVLYQRDLRAALEELAELRTQTAGLRREWGVQAEHSTSASPARTKELAQYVATLYSRVREPGCKPTPHHVVTRLVADWQRIGNDHG